MIVKKQLLNVVIGDAMKSYLILLRWYRARDLFASQIPVTTGGFELRISCIRSSYLTHYDFMAYWVR